MSCDVGEVTEKLEKELCCDYNYELCSFSYLSVTSPTSQLFLQPFRRFTYVTPHPATLPSLHLHHSLFSNHISLHLSYTHFTYATWRAALAREWWKLHDAELHALYSSRNIIRSLTSRRLRWAGHVAHMEQSGNSHRILVRNPNGKRPLRLRRWEDNIKIQLREADCDAGDCIDFAKIGNNVCMQSILPGGRFVPRHALPG